jgi:hypothetical protein
VAKKLLKALYEGVFLLFSCKVSLNLNLNCLDSKICSIKIPNIKAPFPKYFSADRYKFQNKH